ncbi:MAG TPA: alpha/beta hydrolase [Ruminiclostridium sp.]|nr:alpha/beta hydrolase [Ruminiclostridium sp.]
METKLIQKYIKDESKQICYYIGGNLESPDTILFLNGFYHGTESWIKQRRNKEIRGNYKLVFIDYRGSGSSVQKIRTEFKFEDIIDDVNTVLEKEKIKKVIIIGFSFGGMVAQWYAHLNKEKVECLILLNTGLRFGKRSLLIADAAKNLINDGASLANVFSVIYPYNYSSAYLEKLGDLNYKLLDTYTEYNSDLDSLVNLIATIRTVPDIKSVVPEISVPVLLISGDEDAAFPICFQQELKENLKKCEYHVLNNCGHASMIEKYQEVNELIVNFLNKNKFKR